MCNVHHKSFQCIVRCTLQNSAHRTTTTMTTTAFLSQKTNLPSPTPFSSLFLNLFCALKIWVKQQNLSGSFDCVRGWLNNSAVLYGSIKQRSRFSCPASLELWVLLRFLNFFPIVFVRKKMELRILVILLSLSWATAEGRNREEFQAAVQQFPIVDIQTLLLPLQEGSFLAAFSRDSNATGITRPCLDDILEFMGDLRARKPSAVQGKVKELTNQSIQSINHSII